MNKTYTIQDIQLAYRKLKSYFYYDNTSLHIREALAKFEGAGNIEDKLRELLKIINAKNPIKTKGFQFFLDKISILVLPKSYESDKLSGQDEFILSNRIPSLQFKLDRINYFIDAPIQIHIISALWIMKEGFHLQKHFDKNNYGYKIAINENGEINSGLRLFEKYFEQYQNWRDRSISAAKDLLKKDQDAVIVQMDVKEYFHNVELDFLKIKEEILNEGCDKPLKLTDLLKKINQTYSEKLQEEEKTFKINKDKPRLPIGLLSSGVLSNWYLKNLDDKIVKNLAPVFYGRYVDDIVVVLANIKLEDENSPFQSFVKKYFIKNEILKEAKKDYQICLEKTNLFIQKKKFSILEFSHEESLAAINNFVVKLKENSSIFWMLPEDEEDSKDFDESANDLIYGDTINKLRSLNEIIPSKFGASVFLAKKILSSLLADESPTPKTDQQILSFFRGKYALEFYHLWEKVITYFVINGKKNQFWKFYKTCCNAINTLICGEYNKKSGKIKYYLKNHLKQSIAMAIALKPSFLLEEGGLSKKFKKYKDGIDIKEIQKLTNAFRKSNLIRHNYITMPLLNYTEYSLQFDSPYYKPLLIENEVRFLNSIKKEDLEIHFDAYKYSPRHIHLFETNIHAFYLFLLKSSNGENFNKALLEEVLGMSFDNFYRLNYDFRKDLDDNFKAILKKQFFSIVDGENNYAKIKIGDDSNRSQNISVAVANHCVNKANIELSIKNKSKVTSIKKENLIRILNQSEEEKADFLILPEISIPFKWLIRLSDESRRKQRAFITGIEHFSIKKTCYNFMVTVLPIKIGEQVESIIIPRLKNHYSPDEELLIKGIRYKVPESKDFYYHLFKWKGISFVCFNCFELADVEHRALFKGKVDIIFASEYNKDWKYFSNIAESITRDVHCYYVQSNTSDIGDSRIIQPTESNRKDILRLKGGVKSSALVGLLDIQKLRAFQEKEFFLQKELKTFKPTPPSFNKDGVNDR